MPDESQPHAPGRYRTGRVDTFSDGLFAIAITVLIRDIALPAGLVGMFLPIRAVFGYRAIAILILVPVSALRHNASDR